MRHVVPAVLVIGLVCRVSAAEVRWRTGERLPDAMAPTAIHEKAAAWRTQHSQGGPRDRHVLIRFAEPVSANEKQLLASEGIELSQPLGGNAFFARIDAGNIDAVDLQGVKGVRMICDATGVSTRESVPAGETLLPPLSLTISAQPGTYHPSLTDPQFTDTTHVTFPATTGQPLVIAIGQ